ncbi:hypothetical protein FPQ14_00705 [Gilliamella apicola]|uniref:Uncharacterized protein n=1 Tax=Gilliamella apicola TaxID=1196095 RepID=A0A556RSE6_9GAMM|nr:hypothetical protein [Gilliamella apicola]TSJ91820.1 hypothetical protein FPQ14_00705 [Gilliamella apicola]
MLLICLRDDIPLSLNAKQLDVFNHYIQFEVEYPIYISEKYIKNYNNVKKHKIHNVFFVEHSESELDSITFIPDVVCNLYEPIIEPRSGQMVYRDNTAYAGLHDMIFEGQRISFYVDSKIESNDRFEFSDMMQRLLPFIKSHLAGDDISDLYWRQNLRITQIKK